MISCRPESWPTGRAPERHNFDAVVLGGVVGCREHRSRAFHDSGGVVQLIGGGQSQRDGVQPLRIHALSEGLGQGWGGIAHVVADDHLGCALFPHELAERGAGIADKTFIHFVRAVAHHSAHVVCLDDLGNRLG